MARKFAVNTAHDFLQGYDIRCMFQKGGYAPLIQLKERVYGVYPTAVYPPLHNWEFFLIGIFGDGVQLGPLGTAATA
jgi:hypothetical protein